MFLQRIADVFASARFAALEGHDHLISRMSRPVR